MKNYLDVVIAYIYSVDFWIRGTILVIVCGLALVFHQNVFAIGFAIMFIVSAIFTNRKTIHQAMKTQKSYHM